MSYENPEQKDRYGRVLHKTVCSDCKKECFVPFVPDPTRETYCNECYKSHRPARRSGF